MIDESTLDRMQPLSLTHALPSGKYASLNRFKFDPGAPPLCTSCCLSRRAMTGEPINRLVFRPKSRGFCIACGTTVWDSRKRRQAA